MISASINPFSLTVFLVISPLRLTYWFQDCCGSRPCAPWWRKMTCSALWAYASSYPTASRTDYLKATAEKAGDVMQGQRLEIDGACGEPYGEEVATERRMVIDRDRASGHGRRTGRDSYRRSIRSIGLLATSRAYRTGARWPSTRNQASNCCPVVQADTGRFASDPSQTAIRSTLTSARCMFRSSSQWSRPHKRSSTRRVAGSKSWLASHVPKPAR